MTDRDVRAGYQVWVAILLFSAVALLFRTSHTEGDFWWSDASRHAMDGAFYYDFFSDLPLGNVREYASGFYIQYPAISILFYPPLFALVESLFFLLFGLSHFSAQLTVAFFYFASAVGVYVLAQRWMSAAYALCAVFLFIGAREIAFWGRQVMLEIPAYAFLIWAVHFFFVFLETERFSFLYGAVFLYALGLYTKLNLIFIAPVFLFFMGTVSGIKIFKDKRIVIMCCVFILMISPLLYVTLKYGQTNIGAVAGGQASNEISRLSLDSWLFYLKKIPSQLGWLLTVIIVSGILIPYIRKPEERLAISFFCFTWFIWGYFFFSMVSLKESRHSLFILFPLIFTAVLNISRAFPGSRTAAGCLLVSVCMFANTLVSNPVPYVRNYGIAANYTADHAPRHSNILIHSYWDGNFIFNLWTRKDRQDMMVLRSDKLLLSMAVKRSMGVEEKVYSDEQISDMLNEYGIYYVVSETDFWNDLAPMRQLQQLLKTEQFREEKRIRIEDNFSDKRRELIIYRNLKCNSNPSTPIKIDLKIIGEVIEGNIGQ